MRIKQMHSSTTRHQNQIQETEYQSSADQSTDEKEELEFLLSLLSIEKLRLVSDLATSVIDLLLPFIQVFDNPIRSFYTHCLRYKIIKKAT